MGQSWLGKMDGCSRCSPGRWVCVGGQALSHDVALRLKEWKDLVEFGLG